MVDVEAVVERLEALQAYVSELDHYAQHSRDEVTSDFVQYRAAQHSLQLAAQAVVDIAVHVLAADHDARVQEYRQAIEALGQVGVLPAELASRLAPLAGLRNLLVHEYLVVEPARVYDLLVGGRADLRAFGRSIAEYLQRPSR